MLRKSRCHQNCQIQKLESPRSDSLITEKLRKKRGAPLTQQGCHLLADRSPVLCGSVFREQITAARLLQISLGFNFSKAAAEKSRNLARSGKGGAQKMMLARAFHYSFITAKKGALRTLSLQKLVLVFFWGVCAGRAADAGR